MTELEEALVDNAVFCCETAQELADAIEWIAHLTAAS